MFTNDLTIYWHKLNDAAKIPTKRNEDAGYDIYTNEHYILMPGEKHLFPTGLQYIMSRNDYWLMAFDRGSTGSKGIHVHCGVCDNGYRGEVFICLSNDNTYPVVFTDGILQPYFKEVAFCKDDYCGPIFYYPLSKAIAQLIPVAMPNAQSVEIDQDEWDGLMFQFASVRGAQKLGQSGK